MRRLLAVVAAAAVAFILIKATGWPGNGSDTASPPPGSPTSSSSAGALGNDPVSGLPYVTLDELPAEAATVLDEITKGGPFEYPKNDGVVYNNFEGVLPKEKAGYYHEYTVPTPGASNRGTRRVITGSSGELYYTGDHYSTFSRILQ